MNLIDDVYETGHGKHMPIVYFMANVALCVDSLRSLRDQTPSVPI